MANVMQGVEVEFRDLTKEAQESLYLSDKEKFKNEAANSGYVNIRRMVAENEYSSCEFLNAMFREEITNKDKQSDNVEYAIFANPKFTMEEETRKLCAESDYWKYREIVAKDENSSSKFLNAMLREEITNEDKQDDDVLSAIFANPKFTMKEKTRKLCAESDHWEYRKIAAKDKGSSSEFLNAMLREEITNEDKRDKDVIKAILSNKNLLLQDDLRNACAEINNWEVRLMIAKDAKTPKELLEAMSKGEEIENIKDAINTNLSNKEKNKQVLEVLKGFIPSENQAVECLEKIKAIIY